MTHISDLIKLTEEFYKQSLWNYFMVKTAAGEMDSDLKKKLKERINNLKSVISKCEDTLSEAEDAVDSVVNDSLFKALNDEDDESSLITSFKDYVEYLKKIISTERINRADLNDKIYNIGAGFQGVNNVITLMNDSDWEEENANSDELIKLMEDIKNCCIETMKVLTGEDLQFAELILGSSEDSIQGQLSELGSGTGTGSSEAEIEAARRHRESRTKANSKYLEAIRIRSRLTEGHPLYGTETYDRAVAVMDNIRKKSKNFFEKIKQDPERYALYLEKQRTRITGISNLEKKIEDYKKELKFVTGDEEDKIRRKIISLERRIQKTKSSREKEQQKRSGVLGGKEGELPKILLKARQWVAAAKMGRKDKFFDPVYKKIIDEYQSSEYAVYRAYTDKITAAKIKHDEAKKSGSKKDFDDSKKALEASIKQLKDKLYQDMDSDFEEYLKKLGDKFEETHGKEMLDVIKEINSKANSIADIMKMNKDNLSNSDKEKIKNISEFLPLISEKIDTLYPKLIPKAKEYFDNIQIELLAVSDKIENL